MARWLPMSQDRIGGDRVPQTQEFLSHILGTRASVTVAAALLQKTGSIKYERGAVAVLSREKLEEPACECYQALTRQSQSWHNEQPSWQCIPFSSLPDRFCCLSHSEA